MTERPDLDAQQLLALLRQRFLCRSDVFAFLASWEKPCPTQEGTDLDALLAAHVSGEAAPKASVRYRNRYGIGAELGWFRVGTYTPALDGTTKWLCLDFDGSGHAEAIADPKAAALAVHQAFTQAGIPSHLELSGGGKGWHLWCFFDPPVPARLSRALAFALLPCEVTLASGEVVQANTGRVIEIFPKQTKIEDGGYGNLVWLPWWSKAEWPANQFHRLDEAGELVPHLPESFDTANLEAVEALVAASRAEAKEQRRQEKQQATERSWQEWRGRALGALPLDAVYGEWLTGKRHSTGWLECRDPESPSGDRDPSAGVADGTGQAERGQFHSFISGKSVSVFDFLIERGLAADFRAAREKIAKLSGVPLPETEKKSRGRGLPEIVVNNRQLRDIIADAWAALHLKNNPPVLFRRGKEPVRLTCNSDADQGPVGPRIESAEETLIHGLLIRAADWVKRSKEEVSHARPPREVAADILVLCDERLPMLYDVITTPVFGSDGQLVDQPGYHQSERLWYEPHQQLDLSELPERPTAEQVAAAKSLLLDELFVDFPFVSESERAHAVAALILPFVRRMIDGPTPIHLVEAPRIGSGKGLLCHLISIVCTGVGYAGRTLPRNEDEARKMITAELASGRPIALLDNADEKRALHCPSLASVVTSPDWTDRLLGQTRMLTIPNRALWLLTANNPRLSLEIARRCVRIRIDPKMERPWWREGFKHDPVIEWAKDNRPQLVHAVLMLIRAWIASGKPLHKRRLGSFERWSGVLGGILDVTGIPGFLDHLEDLYESADTDGNEWREFIVSWWEAFGDHSVTVKQLLELALDRDLLGTVIGDKSLRSQQTRLGHSLSAMRDQQIGEWRVRTQHDSHTKSASYRLVPAEARGTSGTLVRDLESGGPAVKAALGLDYEAPGESAGPCGTLVDSLAREADRAQGGLTHNAHAYTGGQNASSPARSRTSRSGTAEAPQKPDSARDLDSGGPATRSRENTQRSRKEPDHITDLAQLPDEWEDGGESADSGSARAAGDG